MSRIASLVSIVGLSASVAVFPADVQAFHSPNLTTDATTIVHNIRAGKLPREINKSGHDPDYINRLVMDLKGRIGKTYDITYDDNGLYWTLKFQRNK